MVNRQTDADRVRVVTELQKNAALYRVAYFIAKGYGQPAELEQLSTMDGVMAAMSRLWVAPPLDDGFPYQLTDTGRRELARWHRIVSARRATDNVFASIWEAVTDR